ncbi:Os02g0552550 [Oryza sativa Japonica Group]|jgi:hypothetical protein|uniref:Os02g0552550 protein n=1 Tax=Oryza sativa subsp. japonica TaxID=39947 RepID=A0A0P0VK86_ORYSJ|nr:hypothetical protein EE612_011704 [Oryza sativa]BAS79182.1 Os02g0552550 [Oryza sativa Japonica Group]
MSLGHNPEVAKAITQKLLTSIFNVINIQYTLNWILLPRELPLCSKNNSEMWKHLSELCATEIIEIPGPYMLMIHRQIKYFTRCNVEQNVVQTG